MQMEQLDVVSLHLVAGAAELNTVDMEKLRAIAQMDGKRYWDDVFGNVLGPALTQQARMEEIQWAEQMGGGMDEG